MALLTTRNCRSNAANNRCDWAILLTNVRQERFLRMSYADSSSLIRNEH
jgi:hypothetical protein